jgi:hypothetical protein
MNIKGLKKIIHAIADLQMLIENETRSALDDAREKFNDRSDRFKISDNGLETDDILYRIESFLDEIENIEIPDIESEKEGLK